MSDLFTRNAMRSAVLAAGMLIAAPALAATVVATGSQTAGSGGRNAQLSGNAFSLPATCTITKVTGNNEGFWLQGSQRIVFDSMGAAQGRQVPAGTYNVYPNLSRGAAQASVQVTFTCP